MRLGQRKNIAILLTLLFGLAVCYHLTNPERLKCPPWQLSPTIGPGIGNPLGWKSHRPEWSTDWETRLSLNPRIIARPFGDSCVSGLNCDIQEHDRTCKGAACIASRKGTFLWAEFGGEASESEFFFEYKIDHYGGTWTAWLILHDGNLSNGMAEVEVPVYIEQGFSFIEDTNEFVDSLKAAGVLKATGFRPDTGSVNRLYFVDDDGENFVDIFGDRVNSNIVEVVEASFIQRVKIELEARASKGWEPEGSWKLKDGIWPGEKSSLFQDFEKASRGW